MHRSAFVLIAGVVLALWTPLHLSDAQAKSVHKEFSEAWEERDERYIEQYEKADADAREAATEFFTIIQTEGADIEPPLTKLTERMDAASYLYGRRVTIWALREHMDDKPSAASTELWMQEQVSELQADAHRVDALSDAAKSAPEGQTLQEGLNKFEAAITLGGQVRGRLEELQLIDQNLASYYRGKGEESQRRRQRAAAFLALGSSLQQSAAQRQANMPKPWTARCSTYGNQTNCTGSR